MTSELTKAAQQALMALRRAVPKDSEQAHEQLLAAQALNTALTQRPAAQADDWRTPTTYAQRFAEAVALLCREMPPADMVAAWIDRSSGDHSLQDWACERAPAWAQGIGLLDAAHVMADQPTEGVNHEPTQPAAQATPEPDDDAQIRAIGEGLRSAHDHIEMHRLERSHCKDAERIREGLAAFSAYKKRGDFAATPEPVGEVFLSAEDGKPIPKLYARHTNLPDGTKLYTRPAPGVPDVEDLRDRLVAISAAVADSDDRAAQSMLGEILRTLAAQAKGGAK